MGEARTQKEAEAEIGVGGGEGNQWHLVGNVEELKLKPCRKLYTKGDGTLALFYLAAQDRFYVTDAACPHARGPLDQGDIEEVAGGGGGYTVTCPLHYYSFDLETGESTSGLKLAVYQTDVRGDSLYALTPHPLSLTRL